MEIGIYGLSYSGKSVLFNLLTGIEESRDKSKTRIGSTAVPDSRLDQLVEWYKSVKKTSVHIDFYDPGIGEKSDDSLSNAQLNPVRHLDTLILVVRCFASDSVPHPEESIDPVRDLDMIFTQFVLADLEIATNRINRLEESLKKTPKAAREPLEREYEVLKKIHAVLDSDNPFEVPELSDAEKLAVKSYAFFSLKKYVVVGNLGDCSNEVERGYWEKLKSEAEKRNLPVVGVNVQIELDFQEMEPEEVSEFRESMGLDAESRDVLLRTIYNQLGLVTFYTAGPKESAARIVPEGSSAPKAAGTIHSDMEQGFIRMEVMNYEDLVKADGSEAKVKQAGAFRLEGKDYIVQDGDVVIIRFSV